MRTTLTPNFIGLELVKLLVTKGYPRERENELWDLATRLLSTPVEIIMPPAWGQEALEPEEKNSYKQPEPNLGDDIPF